MENNVEIKVSIQLASPLHERLTHVAALLDTSVPKLVESAATTAVTSELERLVGNVHATFRAHAARTSFTATAAPANGGNGAPARKRKRNRMPNVDDAIAREWKRRHKEGETLSHIAHTTGYHPHTVRAWVTG